MMVEDAVIQNLIASIRDGSNRAFTAWALYGVEAEPFIEIVRWMADDPLPEIKGRREWTRAVGLIVPHQYLKTMGGEMKFFQTGPAELHRIIRKHQEESGLSLCQDFDTGKSWHYHRWPHYTMEALIQQKRYQLENSTHRHPELDRYTHPD